MLNAHQKGMVVKNAAMAEEFGVQIDQTRLHEGAYDIYLTSEVFFNLVNKLDLI